MICIGVFSFLYYSNKKQDIKYNTYENSEYHITLQYSKEWKQNDDYDNRFEGKDGFFQISAFNGQDWNIDEVAMHEASHKLKPYGSNPVISKRLIHGLDERIILPSSDQAKEMNNQAEIIMKYPTAIEINGSQYYYFILYADKNHILKIAETIKFIS